jgi:hypothetical protein
MWHGVHLTPSKKLPELHSAQLLVPLHQRQLAALQLTQNPCQELYFILAIILHTVQPAVYEQSLQFVAQDIQTFDEPIQFPVWQDVQ